MNYIKDMMNRTSLKDISQYIRSGGSLSKINEENFAIRLQNAYGELIKDLHKRFPSETVEELLGIIEDYYCVADEVSFSLGIKAGERLMIQLTGNVESDF